MGALSNVGNLLLVAGTIAGAVAAAASERASRSIALAAEAAFPGEYLFDEVRVAGDIVADEGTELDEALVARLRAAGVEAVEVRNPPRSAERAELGGELEGRVLAQDVELGAEEHRLAAGETLDAGDERRILAAGAAEVWLAGPGGERRWTPPAEGAEGDDDELAGQTLSRPLVLRVPERMAAGSFLDARRVERLRAAGVDAVELQITKDFYLGEWKLRWLFALGVLAMIGGIGLKRADRPVADTTAAAPGTAPAGGIAGLRATLAELAAAVEELGRRADGLDAAALHRALDPLTSVACYRIVEGRRTIAAALGLRGYGEVMSAFSTGERKLNRAWSAAVDGAAEEARDSLRLAGPPLRQALELWTAQGPRA